MLSSFSCVWLFVTLWTVAGQAPLSIGFSMQEYWSGLLCPPPGNLPNPEIKPASIKSSVLAGGFFTTSVKKVHIKKSLKEKKKTRVRQTLIGKVCPTKWNQQQL